MQRRRQILIATGACAVVFPSLVRAQRPMRRIGFLSLGSSSENATRIAGLRSGLREFGYVEGRDLTIEYRMAEGRAPLMAQLAADLVKADVELIVTHGPSGIRAAQKATTTVPIVVAAIGDVLAGGFVESLSRPGGNVTGLSFFSPEISAKRLQLLRETLPRATAVGVLLNPDNPINFTAFEAVAKAGAGMKVGAVAYRARGRGEFESAFEEMVKARVNAVVMIDDTVISTNLPALAELAARHRLPALASPEYVDVGGWIGYGVNIPAQFRRSAYFVDRIFKGARPADLPIQQPTNFELAVNRAASRTLGIPLPQALLVRADRVVEQ